MKLYNIQILSLYETLNEFPKQISESLPIRLGFKILTNSKNITILLRLNSKNEK